MDIHLDPALRAMEETLAASDLPSVALGITDHECVRAVVLHGSADPASRTPLRPDSRFAIGSVSKSFTAVALMQLSAEGRLDLHAPITRYLPVLSEHSYFDRVTAHHLLTHTAGIPSYLGHVCSSRYVMAELLNFVPSYAPGDHWWYSNTGYQLLGYLLERVEGLPYAKIIERRILGPLGMTSTAAVIDDAERASIVSSYVRWPYDGTYREAPWFEYSASDGSLISSIPDMCAYARFLLNRGAGETSSLLSEAAFVALTTPVLDDYAYGLVVRTENQRKMIGHDGGIAGFYSSLEVYPEDGFGLMLLSGSPIHSGLRRWLSATAMAAIRGTELPTPPTPQEVNRIKAEAYAHTYHLASAHEGSLARTLRFTASNGQLFLDQGGFMQAVQRMGGDCFRLKGRASDSLPFIFSRGAEGSAQESVLEVSHGAQWYVREDCLGTIGLSAPQDYTAYVGHFENNGPEGPVARVFVRNGRLWVLMSLTEHGEPTPLEPIREGLFRFGEEEYSPERVWFDTVVEGSALRMSVSGVPLYRKETP